MQQTKSTAFFHRALQMMRTKTELPWHGNEVEQWYVTIHVKAENFTWIIVPNWTRYRRLPAVNLIKNIAVHANNINLHKINKHYCTTLMQCYTLTMIITNMNADWKQLKNLGTKTQDKSKSKMIRSSQSAKSKVHYDYILITSIFSTAWSTISNTTQSAQ